jgi:hypothetical protein
MTSREPDNRSGCRYIKIDLSEVPRRFQLLHAIFRRVWQRAFVILNPYVIPPIDPAVARAASEKMTSLTDAKPVSALAEHPSRVVSVLGLT